MLKFAFSGFKELGLDCLPSRNPTVKKPSSRYSGKMASAIFLILACFAQDAVQLELGKPITGSITDSAAVVHTQTLSAEYSTSRTVGRPFQLKALDPGPYFIELRSYDFDAYLIIRKSNGEIIAEDDDGLLGTHARLTFEVQTNQEYSLSVCALRGARGEFNLSLFRGTPRRLSRVKRTELDVQDARRRLAHLEQNKNPDSPDIAEALFGLAKFLKVQGKYEEAQLLFERFLAIQEKLHGPDHANTAYALNALASLLSARGKYENARPLMERALAIREKALGPNHALTSNSLSNLALLLSAQGKYEEARPLQERDLAIKLQLFGPNHPKTGTGFNNIAGRLSSQGKYQEARTYYERSLEICENALGPEHPTTAASLNNLASLLLKMGNYVEARPLLERSLVIREKVRGPEHLDTAKTLINLGRLYVKQGSYQAARPLFERSLAIREKMLGAEHPETAMSMNRLASLLKDQGKYEEALPLYERSLAVVEKVFGPGHPSTGVALNALGTLFEEQGKHQQARHLFERALAIIENALGPDHPRMVASLSNLAINLMAQAEYEEALSLCRRALANREKALGPDHPDTGKSLNYLALVLKTMGKYEEARPLYERALTIREKVLGPNHPSTGRSLNNLSSLLYSQGKYEEAGPLIERGLAIMERAFGPENPSTIQFLDNLALLHKKQGKYEGARSLYERALSSSSNFLDRELPTQSEAGRLQLLAVAANPEGLLSCLGAAEPSSLAAAYELFQCWKGKATRLQAASILLKQVSSDAASRKKKGRIQVLAKKLSSLVLLPLADQQEDHEEQIQSLRKERIRLEHELNRELGLDLVLATPGLKEVQAGMPENSVLVDFFVGKDVYAWILTREGNPQLIPLGDADALRDAQEAFLRRTAVRGGKLLATGKTDPGAELKKLLWEPIREAVGKANWVLVSPDGFLCELPFGILQESNGSYLLENHHFVYLSDPTRLAHGARGDEAAEGSLIAIGAINYFRRDDAPEGLAAAVSTRSRIGTGWDSLPATKQELQALRDLHDLVLEWQSPMTVVEGKAATEESIRAQLPGHRYIHIATHGYFEPDHLPSLLLDAEEKQAKAELGEQIRAVGLLPGLLSGLVFAGVNDKPDPGRDDGYLSAEEIQHLDLSACDMVVLSACDTALGSLRAGEGLMSLRRAFSVAGANTVVSSLWKVNDQATATLMKDFYTNLWQNGMSRGDSLHEAKLRMLRRSRLEFSGNARPGDWGAFVLSGDWN